MTDWKTACGKALTLNERRLLVRLAKQVSEANERPVIVNIGVFRCASMYCLRVGARNARLVGIDVKWCAVPIDKGLRAEFIIGDSRKCCADFKVPINLLFIDGDHHYSVVKADLNNWTPKVLVGGTIALHDCYPLPKDLAKIPYLEGVNRAVNEWLDVTKWEELKPMDSVRSFCRIA